jgi:hypothetical protein
MKFLNFPVLTALSGDPGSPGGGSVYINTTTGLKWFNSTWSTAADLESKQTFLGAKTFTGTVAIGTDLIHSSTSKSYSRGTVQNGYAQIVATSAVTASTTAVLVTGMSITVTLDPLRRYRLESWGQVQSTVASDRVGIALKDGATQLTGSFVQVPVAAVGFFYHLVAFLNGPTTGSHTLTFNVYRNAGTGNVSVVAGSGAPAFITIEDLGDLN